MKQSNPSAPILLSPPHLTGEERLFVDEAFRSNWIAPLGPAFARHAPLVPGKPGHDCVSTDISALSRSRPP